MAKRPIIIDTDPGIDDAVAIGVALFHEDLDVKLITTVAGNVSVDLVTENALKLLTFWKKDIPVAKGANEPLLRPVIDASDVHGHSGMDGYTFDAPKEGLLLKENAVEAMRNVIRDSPEKITLVPIGPLTNIALLLKTYPEVKGNIREIVLMGGSTTRGNRGVMAEFNIAVDPEAAKIVFASGLPVVMAGLDVGLKALVYPEDSELIRTLNPTGQMLYSLFQHYRSHGMKKGLQMYDSCAIAYLVAPEMFEVTECFVDVEIQGALTSGATVVDLRGYLGKAPNTKVLTDVDTDMFRKWLIEAIRGTVPFTSL